MIIISIVLFITLLFIIFLYYFDAKQCVNNNIILGVTLPLNKVKDTQVLNILTEYKSKLKKYLIIEIFLSFIIIILYKYFFITMLCYISLIFIGCGINFLIIKKYNLKMKKLKEENNWSIGEKHIISIDTKLTLLKDSMVVNKLFFIPIFFFSLMTFLIGFLNFKNIPEIIYLAIINIILNLLMLWLYKIIKSLKNKIYSENSDINITLNKYKKYLITKNIIIISYIFTFLSLISVFILKDNPNNANIYFILMGLFSLSLPITFLYFNNKIKNTEKEILQLDKAPILVDEDDFWKYGMFYYNPNSKKRFVEKRIGVGLIYNMPYKLNYSLNILGIIITFFVIFSILPLEFSDINVYEENNILKIKFPMYSTEIEKQDIKDIYVINEEIKIGNRLNGYSSEDKAIGKFRVDVKGEQDIYKIFINVNNKDKAIIIDLKDNEDIILNGKDDKETEKIIEVIKEFKNKK